MTTRNLSRVEQMRNAAIAAAYHEPDDGPEPLEPTASEALYLEARRLFRAGRHCDGWDAIEAGDAHHETRCGLSFDGVPVGSL